MEILDAGGTTLGHLKESDTGKGRWSYTDVAGTRVDFSAATRDAAFAHAGELILAQSPDAGKRPPR